MNVNDYLSRIGFRVSKPPPSFNLLRSLQRSHLLRVPFENLDIQWKRPIVLDTQRFYAKIVGEKRGGFCYELNGLFNVLLRELGFQTRLISARVFSPSEGKHGPDYDHAAIIVTTGEEEYLTDVGFGAFAAEPLRFALDVEQTDPTGTFLLRKREDDYFEVLKSGEGGWRSEYIFQDVDHDLSDFSQMCDFQQYSPDSHFTKGKLCSIMTETGRKTLTDKSFIVTNGNNKNETLIDSEVEFYRLLKGEFGIEQSIA